MSQNLSADLARLLEPEQIIVDLQSFSPGAGISLLGLLKLFDLEPSKTLRAAPRIITFDGLSAMSLSERQAFRAGITEYPAFVCPGANMPDKDIVVLIKELTGAEISLCASAPAPHYHFARRSAVWPFSGTRISESTSRILSAVSAASASITPLVSTDHGIVFLHIDRGKGVYICTVPLAEAPRNGLLKSELDHDRFMGLLPLVLFLRAAFHSRRWERRTNCATFMVDDPNLRHTRYGYMDLNQLVAESKRHNFHTSIAMIPLDYQKTRKAAADIMSNNPDRLSLVMHGVDHVRGEFAAPVRLQVAETMLLQGLARMDRHERRTGLRYAHAMTFPHGLCNKVWMEAMRNVGFSAAIASRSLPFCSEDEIGDSLYELSPAQMTFRGFPTINRFQAEMPKERLLFQALLQKPLIVYTHHPFFAEGIEPLIEIANFMNQQVSPVWSSVDAIVRSNYQVKQCAELSVVRAFSNRITVPKEDLPVALVKPGTDFPADEQCRVGQTLIDPLRTTTGLVALVPEPLGGASDFVFERRDVLHSVPVRRPRFRSQVRRLATEVRDQIVMPAFRQVDVRRQRIGRSSR
jgi:hypothetical protein